MYSYGPTDMRQLQQDQPYWYEEDNETFVLYKRGQLVQPLARFYGVDRYKHAEAFCASIDKV